MSELAYCVVLAASTQIGHRAERAIGMPAQSLSHLPEARSSATSVLSNQCRLDRVLAYMPWPILVNEEHHSGTGSALCNGHERPILTPREEVSRR